MSTIAKCQKCGQQVAIPSGMAFDATVRCPLCKTEFPLRALLIGEVASPPELEAVSSVPGPVSQSPVVVPAAEPPAADAPIQPAAEVVAAVAPAAEIAATQEIVAEVVPEPTVPQADAEIGLAAPAEAVTEAAVAEEPKLESIPPAEATEEPKPETITQAVATEESSPETVTQAVATEEPEPETVTQAVATEPEEAIGVSRELVAETPYVGEDAPDWNPQSDGAAVSGELMDLWKEAGVAPPIDAPETVAATQPASPVATAVPAAYEYTGAPTDGAGRPLGPAQSFAAQARKAEQPVSRKVIRIVGVIVAGLMGVLMAWVLFLAISWIGGCRKTPSTAGPKSQATGKPAPSPQAPIVPTKKEEERWKGLK